MKGNYPVGGTHVSLNHVYGRKGSRRGFGWLGAIVWLRRRQEAHELMKGATREHFSDTAAARVKEYLRGQRTAVVAQRTSYPPEVSHFAPEMLTKSQSERRIVFQSHPCFQGRAVKNFRGVFGTSIFKGIHGNLLKLQLRKKFQTKISPLNGGFKWWFSFLSINPYEFFSHFHEYFP